MPQSLTCPSVSVAAAQLAGSSLSQHAAGSSPFRAEQRERLNYQPGDYCYCPFPLLYDTRAADFVAKVGEFHPLIEEGHLDLAVWPKGWLARVLTCAGPSSDLNATNISSF